MTYPSRRAAVVSLLALAALPAHAEMSSDDSSTGAPATYAPASPHSLDDQGRTEVVMPRADAPTPSSVSSGLPAAVPAEAPVPAAAPAAMPASKVPMEQAPAPVSIVPPVVTKPTPPMKPVVSKPGVEHVHPIPTINTKQPAEVASEVTYVTGGIGDDEKQSLEASKHDYNVHVMSASTTGAFVGDSHVVIKNKAGQVMLDVTAGPLLYVKLPEGSYVLEAVLGEQQKKQAITLSTKSPESTVHLGWKVDATLSN